MVCLITKVEISHRIIWSAIIHVNHIYNTIVVILYRYDNDIIFEEKLAGDKMPVDPAAIIFEKDSKKYTILNLKENYWFYHKGTVEDYE